MKRALRLAVGAWSLGTLFVAGAAYQGAYLTSAAVLVGIALFLKVLEDALR